MTRWRIEVSSHLGTLRIYLYDGKNVIGMASMSQHDYTTLCKDFVKFLGTRVMEVITLVLCDSLGWSKEMVNQYSTRIAQDVMRSVLLYLPEFK